MLTDGDGTSDYDEITQGSYINDASDNGELSDEEKENQITVKLRVGDPSGSHSERMIAIVSELNENIGERVLLNHQNKEYGTVTADNISIFKNFRKNKSYSIQLKHVGTDPSIKEKYKKNMVSYNRSFPNYDWLLEGSVINKDGSEVPLSNYFVILDPWDPLEKKVPMGATSLMGKYQTAPYGKNNKQHFIDNFENRRVLLMPVDIEHVDRDDPTQNYSNESQRAKIDFDDTVYAGSVEVQDHIAFKLSEDLSDQIKNWKAVASEGYTLPTQTGSTTGHEWILDGNTYSFDWKPGKYDIQATLGSETVTFGTIEVGTRTDDILVIGWINAEDVLLSTNGVQQALINTLPVNGIAESDSNTVKVFAGEYIKMLKNGVDINKIFEVDPEVFGIDSLFHGGRDFEPLSTADKKYTLNWMFKFADNDEPPSSFQSNGIISEDLILNFLDFGESSGKGKFTNFKLYNRYQVKFQVSDLGTFKDNLVVSSEGSKVEMGNTKDPARIYSLNSSASIDGIINGLIGSWIASIEGYPSDGVFPGKAQLNNGVISTDTVSYTMQCNEGTPDDDALKAFKTITGEDQGYIWSSLTFYSGNEQYSESVFTRDPKPQKTYEGRINTQVYPTYHIYVNGLLQNIQEQASEPQALFPNLDRCQ
jgi:hypothetical protein